MNNEQDNDTVLDTLRIIKEKQLNRKEPPTSENGNSTQPNNAHTNNPKETLSHEQKLNLENLKRIMNREKTNLPSLRNIEWMTVKTETNKINQVIPYI